DETIAALEANASLKHLAQPLRDGLAGLREVTNWIFENGLADPKQALAGATPYLTMFGIVTGGWFSAQLALGAAADLAAGIDDEAYLKARITSSTFFIEQIVPRAAGLKASVTAGASVLYEVDAATLASL
ncbi:MAG: acyl-CoA dehydrogenase, partial [Actinobacteria bacterium]|nr:acyl-CoA dehydrogenase [Actinomycetota bacterium]